MKQGNSKGAENVQNILHGQLLAVLSDIEKQSPSELPSDTSTQYDSVTATKATNKERE